MSSRPIVANSVGEQRAVSVLICSDDRPGELFTLSVLVPSLMVPARVHTVAAIACERIVLLVEAKSIDLVAISRLLHCVLLAVTLEAEALLVVKAWHLGVVKLYGAAALNRANAESFAIGEAHQRASRKFEWRIYQVMRVESIFSKSLFEVPHMDQSVLMRRHEQRPREGGVVTWHSDVNALLTD